LLIQLYYFGKKNIFYGKAAFTKHDLAKITNHRSGEIKFGENA
jgi:hypothetical protein